MMTLAKLVPVGLASAFLLVGLWVEPALPGKITNEPKEFNGYKLGASIGEYPSLKLVADQNVAHPLPFVDVYENPGEVLTLNGVTFSRIHYRFYKERLGGILLTFESRTNRDKLLEWVEERFGKLPPPERKQINLIEWHGADTVISLGYNPTTKLGRLWFTYLPFSPFDNATTDTSGY